MSEPEYLARVSVSFQQRDRSRKKLEIPHHPTRNLKGYSPRQAGKYGGRGLSVGQKSEH